MAHLRVGRAGQFQHADLARQDPDQTKILPPQPIIEPCYYRRHFFHHWSKVHGRRGDRRSFATHPIRACREPRRRCGQSSRSFKRGQNDGLSVNRRRKSPVGGESRGRADKTERIMANEVRRQPLCFGRRGGATEEGYRGRLMRPLLCGEGAGRRNRPLLPRHTCQRNA